MKGKGALALLLLTGGGLIYAASHQGHETVGSGGHAAASRPNGHGTIRLAGMTAGLPEQVLAERLDRVLGRMMADVPTGQDTNRFVCKRPADVGPVPHLDAVDAYLAGLPDSRGDRQLVRGLHRAANEGNWLAKVQVYLLLAAQPAPDSATAYRTLTLMEWMQARHIGALYGAVGDALATAGYRDERPHRDGIGSLDIYAAMHHDYPSQYKVGRALVRGGDTQQAAVGRRMLACAAAALPAYARLYGDAAVAARQ